MPRSSSRKVWGPQCNDHKAVITVDTPFGMTDEFTVYDVIKQGTLSGVLLCGSEVDQVNKINEVVAVPNGPDVDIGMPEYVDDISTAGDKIDVEKGIRNCRHMEKYKFSYGLEKTKYLVVKTGYDSPEAVEEYVKQGKVQQTQEYQYVGIWINEKGNLSTHLKFLEQKARSNMKELLNIGHEANVGP